MPETEEPEQVPLTEDEIQRLARAIENERQARENSWGSILGELLGAALGVAVIWAIFWVWLW